ncbi:uncharacterized protein LOC109707473 [Ananas comosus]|uniref:Uncharacterized protein LOC109707473 n=1 Tax=Ananas comosus TaxID=4615 RepID=A0A6P5ESQ8_ANACO|nr:uncharacterized protein LOC109707473 [Ananas comosus]
MAPFEALYGRKCQSPIHWSDVGERAALGPDVLREAEEKVRLTCEKLLAAQSRQKSYSDKRSRDLEFVVGNCVFLKVSPMRCVKRFGVRGKLSPRYIGPFEVLECVGAVAYRLALPPKLADVRKLRNREIPDVKIRWTNHDDREVTWELKEAMKVHYPHLFEVMS